MTTALTFQIDSTVDSAIELAAAPAPMRAIPPPYGELKMVEPEWKPIDTAPIGEVVMTKIDDRDGRRNEQELKRIAGSNLWWTPSGDMYVYYTPTHWKARP